MNKFILFLALCVSLFFACPAQADDVERRLELARQMQDLRPAVAQINSAIDEYVSKMSEERRVTTRAAIQKALNYEALEKISIDAYAEVFTAKELEVMIAYYSTPESLSVAEKTKDYAQIVYPEIIRMLDKALMRAKTER